jgi:hypothetical protein
VVEQRFSLNVIALLNLQFADGMQGLADGSRFRPEASFTDCQSPLEQRFGLWIIAKGGVNHAESLERIGGVRVIGTKGGFGDAHRVLCQGDGFGRLALFLQLVNLRVEFFPARFLRAEGKRQERCY